MTFPETSYGIVKRLQTIEAWTAGVAERLGTPTLSILDFGCGTGDHVTYPPQNFRQPKTIEALVKLKRESKSIKELVENKASNNEIFETLKSIHHTFIKMSDLCCQKK